MDGRRPAFARVHRTRPTGRLAPHPPWPETGVEYAGFPPRSSPRRGRCRRWAARRSFWASPRRGRGRSRTGTPTAELSGRLDRQWLL